MKSITLNEASKNLSSYMNYTISSHDEVSVASDDGAIVMISQEDYNAMQETLRLLSDKKSLKALLDSHFARDNNLEIEKYNIKEVFDDL